MVEFNENYRLKIIMTWLSNRAVSAATDLETQKPRFPQFVSFGQQETFHHITFLILTEKNLHVVFRDTLCDLHLCRCVTIK